MSIRCWFGHDMKRVTAPARYKVATEFDVFHIAKAGAMCRRCMALELVAVHGDLFTKVALSGPTKTHDEMWAELREATGAGTYPFYGRHWAETAPF